jgi:hypothetical protein
MSRSIQQLPNNSGTASVTEVYTATGFNAGDPVYFQNGDYKNPANLTPPSTVNFNFALPAAINPNGVGGIISPAFSFAQMQTGISGGTSRKFAAVLTDGNIVQVWTNYTQSPSTPNQVYFRIVDSTNTVVVAPTSVSATFTNASYSAVSVVALIGGGFAVGWINNTGGTANSVNYAIYDNSGTVVTAATQDTSFSLGASYVPIEMTSLANGGFAIAAKNTSSQIFLRAYNATGVGAYATIATGIIAAAVENSFAFTSRSDSSLFVCDRFNTTTYYYRLYNSAGAAIIGITQFTTPSGISSSAQGAGNPDASVQADGTTIVIGYYSSNGTYGYPAFRFLPLSNTMGAENIAIPIANSFYQTNYAGGYLSLQCLSSGNFIMYFSDGYGNMQYAFYNSSGVSVSGSNVTGAIPIQVTGGFAGRYSKITLIESGGFVNAYWVSATNQQKPVNQVFCKISTSNYAIQPVSSTTGPSVVVTGQPAGAFIPSTVNPNSLSFYSTVNSATVVTNTPSTVSGPTVVSGSSANSIASCTLPNGNFVVAWKSSSAPYPVYASVYSPTGLLITTATVSTSGNGTDFSVRVGALSGGGFVVAYTSTSNTVATLQVFSSGYSPTSSVNVTITGYSTSLVFDISGMTDNNFVFVYSVDGSSLVYARVYDSSLTLLSQITTTSLAQSLTAAGNNHGGFAVCGWYSSGGPGYSQTFVPTAPNTWTSSAVVSFSMSAAIQSPQLCATESGMYIYTSYESGYPDYFMFTDSGAATVGSTAALSSWPLGSTNGPISNPMMGIGLTGNGNVVIATAYDSTQIGIACLPAQMTFSSGQQLPYQITGTSNVPMFSNNGYSVSGSYGLAAQPRVTSGVGNNCVLTFLNTSRFPTFLIINGTSVSNSYPIVAGVTPSALTPIAPTTTSSNIAGVFAGVAITGATAGSTGQLANNGQVLLGASYTSTATGAFDSTGAAVNGVKGTFNGRSVNLQGNS